MAMAGGKKKNGQAKPGENIGDEEHSSVPPPAGIEEDYRPWEKEQPEQPPPTGGNVAKDEVRNRLAAKHLPNGYDIPDGFGDNDAWVSDDCKAYAIGGNFFPSHLDNVSATYAQIIQQLIETEDPGLYEVAVMSSPREWDARTMVEFSGNVYFDNPGLVWARSRLPPDCAALVPSAANYQDWDSYNQAWEAFAGAHPTLSDFVTQMAEYADAQMHEVWIYGGPADEIYFDLAGEPITAGEVYDMRIVVREVIEEAPGMDVNDKTGLAYERLFSDLDLCPAVIDPNNPDDEKCKELWLYLRELTAAYGG